MVRGMELRSIRTKSYDDMAGPALVFVSSPSLKKNSGEKPVEEWEDADIDPAQNLRPYSTISGWNCGI